MTAEITDAQLIARKLRTPLTGEGDFLKGGYQQLGYGVPSGAAIDGSHAFEGSQGYYTPAGKQAFLNAVQEMKRFFVRHAKKGKGKDIRYVIKPGIGGQHTPFQGIADWMKLTLKKGYLVAGEYELGKDFDRSIQRSLSALHARWTQLAVFPSSKSGSTDETMLIFVQILYSLTKHLRDEAFATLFLDTLHMVNFSDEKERSAKELFAVDPRRFKGQNSLVELVCSQAHEHKLRITLEEVRTFFQQLIGHMVFETTPRPDQSRLAAFLQNSGLSKELGAEAPEVIDMFDNVGGRWTGDLHMMAHLSFHDLDAEAYWTVRQKGIDQVREGSHDGNRFGHKILDDGITDIALVVPEELFWFGKAIEQNFNESIWQEGFANLIAIQERDWKAQKAHYQKPTKRLVVNLSQTKISTEEFDVVEPSVRAALVDKRASAQTRAQTIGELFTTFYGMTNTVGTRLIARALQRADLSAAEIDLNDLNRPATKIVQENLFLRQPFVELGKKLLEKRLSQLQDGERHSPGALQAAHANSQERARKHELQTNLAGCPSSLPHRKAWAVLLTQIRHLAQQENRKIVPFIYLEGQKFVDLRKQLTRQGVEWVLQGTGDQHISYQQVLAQPQKFLPFIISFVPEKMLPGLPAIGFAKGYLHHVSPHLVRDYFAEASYQALLSQKGKGLFLRLIDNPTEINMLKLAYSQIKL